MTLGTIVSILPPNREIVYVNGNPYFYYGGVYYTVAPNGGYIVVNPTPPVVIPPPPPQPPTQVIIQQPAPQPVQPQIIYQQTQPTTAVQPTVNNTADPQVKVTETTQFNIYLSNGNGTFTVVPLIKTQTGFMGPQGEFYQDHPTIEQLTIRYGKTK